MPWAGMTPVLSAEACGGMVGLARFELTTFRPPVERATRLRYSPTPALYSRGPGEGKGKGASPLGVGDHHRAQRLELGDETSSATCRRRARRARARPRPSRPRAVSTSATPASAKRGLRSLGGRSDAARAPRTAASPRRRAASARTSRRAGSGGRDGARHGGLGGRRGLGLGVGQVPRPMTWRTPVSRRILHALDGHAVVVEQPADAAEQPHVLRAVVAPAAAALDRLHLGEAGLPEAQDVRRHVERVGDLADGAEGFGRLVHDRGSPTACSPCRRAPS